PSYFLLVIVCSVFFFFIFSSSFLFLPLSLHDALPISSTEASSTFFALLFKFQHLLCQIAVALGHLAAGIMGKNAFALGADLLCPDRMGNLGAEHLDFAAIGLPQQGGNLLGEVGAVVHHRQQNAVNLELGVQLPLDLVDGGQQLFQAL